MLEAKRIVEPNLFGVYIQPNSVHCGICLNEISLPERSAGLGLLRDEQVISIEDKPIVFAGDFILAMAIHPMTTAALKVVLKRVHPVYYSLNDCSLKSKPAAPNFSDEFYSNRSIDSALLGSSESFLRSQIRTWC